MPQSYTLKHERSPDFRSGVADGAVVSIVADQFGARVSLTFTRLDARTLSEEVVREDDGTIRAIAGNSNFETVKTIEFSVDMRPDQVMGLVARLIPLSQVSLDVVAGCELPICADCRVG